MSRERGDPDLSALDREIAATLRPPHPFLGPFSRQVPRDGGQRRRGELILILGRIFEAPPRKVIAAAAAVEIIHLASLVHDDVIDGAELRRDLPTLERLQGTGPALLYGDLLFSRGIAIVNRLREPALTDLLLHTVSEICAGEILETRERGTFSWEEETYLEIITLKTASLFEYCCQGPAILAGFSPERLKVLKRFGRNLGLAYQIADDCLDFSPGPARRGKNPLADLRNGVANLPLLYAARDPRLKRELTRINASPGELERVGALVREGGFVAAARKQGEEFEKKARLTAAEIRKWSPAKTGSLLDGYLGEPGPLPSRRRDPLPPAPGKV